MLSEQHDVALRDLMTTPVEQVPGDATATEAVEWFETRGYSAAPVAGSDPVGFTTHDRMQTLAEAAPESTVAENAETLTLSHLVSPDLGFESMLERLSEEPFYFVGWDGQVEGIFTRADLNKPPAHAHLYTLVYELEARLRDLIDAEIDWQAVLRNVPYEGDEFSMQYDLLRSKYGDYVDADLHLRPIDYTTFWQLERIVASHETLWEELPFESRKEAVAALQDIRDLRNQVAHYGNVVHSMDTEMLEGGRNILGLEATYHAIRDVNVLLRESQSGEPTASQ
jgi:CBS domain-containing protein